MPENQLPRDTPPPTDGSLLRRVEAGEPAAAKTLYERYAERLYAMARQHSGADLAARFDPEDILQSVFRTFFRRASRGDYDLPDDDNLGRLLLVITLNKVRAKGAYHRAAMRDVRHTKHGPAADHALDHAFAQEELALLDLRMPGEEQRRVLRIEYYGG
jgi:DNA-directed RNA polymerase specialized sigma24 family protein